LSIVSYLPDGYLCVLWGEDCKYCEMHSLSNEVSGLWQSP